MGEILRCTFFFSEFVLRTFSLPSVVCSSVIRLQKDGEHRLFLTLANTNCRSVVDFGDARLRMVALLADPIKEVLIANNVECDRRNVNRFRVLRLLIYPARLAK